MKLSPRGKPTAIDNPPEAQIVRENAWEALIDRGTFDRVQAKLERRRRRRPAGQGYGYRTHTQANPDAYLLTGLVYCDHCGEKMHGSMSTRRKNGKIYRYPKYVCSTYCRSGKSNPSGCGCHAIRQDVIVDVLVRKLQESVLSGGNRDRLLQKVKKAYARRTKPDGKSVSLLKRRITKLSRDIDRAADRLLRAPEDLTDVLVPKLSAMKRQWQRAEAELAAAQAARRPLDIEAEAEAAVDRIWRLGEELSNAAPARRREVLRRMVSRIELRFDHVQRGKRLECPFRQGMIRLRTDGEIFGSVNRGDWI
jgi:site-specific DNA recombinase